MRYVLALVGFVYRLIDRDCTFQPSYILATRRSKQDAAQEVVLLPPSINTTKIPSPFMLAIARTTTNLLYFPSTLGDYLSHNIVPVQRHNSHRGFVRRHCRSV